MKKPAIFIAGIAMITFTFAFEANAQAPTSSSRFTPRTPTTSSYLNLLGRPGGGGIGFNYYQRVRPEQEFRMANQTLNQSVETLRQRIQEKERSGERLQSGLSQSGHVPRFMSFGGYFTGLGQQR